MTGNLEIPNGTSSSQSGGRGIFDGKPPWKPERNKEVDKVPCAVLREQKEGYGGV
jgi:hypothetical protein